MCFYSSTAFALGDGFEVKGLKVEPIIELKVEHNDNLTSTETLPISTWAYVARPSVDFSIGSDINNATLGYTYERGNFNRSQGDNYSDHFIEAATHNEFSSRVMLETDASYSRTHDPRGSTFTGINTGFSTADKWHELAANATFMYGGERASGRLKMDAGHAVKRYLNHQSETLSRNVDTSYGGATFFYRISPKTSALIEGKYTRYDYKIVGSSLDSNEITLYSGVSWEATAKTTGTIKAGWQRKKFSNTYPTGSNFSWDILVGWEPMSYSFWELSSGYKAKEGDGSAGSFIKAQDVSLSWTHEWSAYLSHEASVSAEYDRYVGTTRKDSIRMAGVTLHYAASSWLKVSAAYDYAKRLSNAVDADYTQNVFSLTLTGSL